MYPAAQVETVYLLVRGKKKASASQRVHDLLCSPLFNLLHKEASNDTVKYSTNPFCRVHAMEGDMGQPNLGLTDQSLGLLTSRVHFVLHCAADIRLEPNAQESLRCVTDCAYAVVDLAGATAMMAAVGCAPAVHGHHSLPADRWLEALPPSQIDAKMAKLAIHNRILATSFSYFL